MEIFIYYFIVSISFASMFVFSYGTEIVKTTLDVLFIFDMDYTEYTWSPLGFLISTFIMSFALMPLFLIMMLVENKWETIDTITSHILEYRFGFEKEK